MKILGSLSFLLVSFLLAGVFPAASGQPSLEEGFEEPPLSARPKGYWDWVNGNFSLSQLTQEMEQAKQQGMGGFDIWDVGTFVDPNQVVPAGPEFMSDQSVQAIGYAVREAERVGMEIGLTLSSSWNAGGSWVPAKYGAMGLFRTRQQVRGPERLNHQFGFPELPKGSGRRTNILEYDEAGNPTYFQDVAVLAYPLNRDSTISAEDVVDLTSYMKDDGRLKWQVPTGDWLVTRYIGIPTGQPLAIPSPNSVGRMLDHFNADAQKMNLEYILEKLKAELGTLEGRALKYLYTDSYEVKAAIWTPSLARDFERLNGYSLIPYLPVLDGFTLENAEVSERFMFDFNKTLSDLIIENHYRLGKQICGEYGLGFHAEAGGPGPPVHNVPFEDLKALGSLTAPRGEFWYNHPRGEVHNNELQIVKGISSASHIYDQTFVEAEAFTSVWVWQEGPGELKPIADRAFCEGLNRIVYHTFPHIPPEAGDPGWVYNFGTLVYTKRAWWPKSKPFHYYLGRTSYMLQQGNFVGDVAFYYGDRAPNFVTFKEIPPDLGFGYDYDVINSDAILSRLEVVDGRFRLPHGQEYEVLVLPKEESMNPKVLSRLMEMVDQGGVVVGPKPLRSYRLKDFVQRDQQVVDMADELWGNCDGESVTEHRYGKGVVYWGVPLKEVLENKGVGLDFRFEGGDSQTSFDFIHRRIDDRDIYFVWNRQNRVVDVDAFFRVTGKRPEIWDPRNGKRVKLELFTQSDESTMLPLRLEPNGSCFVVFQTDEAGSTKEITKDGKPFFPGDRSSFDWSLDHTGESSMLVFEECDLKVSLENGDIKDLPVGAIPDDVRLDGPWRVKFAHGWGAPASVKFDSLISWTESKDHGIRHFSGIASYHKNFELTAKELLDGNRLLLDLGMVKEVAEVYLNGKPLGIQWFEPYRYDITGIAREGTNYLVVEVVNVLSNRLTGDAQLPEQYRRTKSNVVKVPSPWSIDMAEAPLKESGLLGPVRINFAREVKF